VHDKGTVTTDAVGGVPSGSNVTFYFWSNNTCTGTPTAGPADVGVSGTSPAVAENGLPQGPLGAGEYSYKAFFVSGDNTLVADAEGDCEPFKVNKADVTTSTQVHNTAHTDITGTSVPVGTYIHDYATVGTAVTGFTITGTVTFRFFTNGTCTGDPASTETVNVGTESTPQQIAAVGSYAYSAKYNGDANYNASLNSDCEPLTVFQPGLTMGFWGNTNGIQRILNAGGYSAVPITIGRGATIDLQAEALKVLPLTLNACGKGSITIFSGQDATHNCSLATGINMGTLNTAAAQTLALGYNIALVTGYTGQTIASLGCSAYLTAGLLGTNTVNAAFGKAVDLINGSASGGTTTQGQLGAMNLLLSCLNREA
jgi:hypothetical protein